MTQQQLTLNELLITIKICDSRSEKRTQDRTSEVKYEQNFPIHTLLVGRGRLYIYPAFLHKTQSRAMGNTADPL